jgi:hypothetical protein
VTREIFQRRWPERKALIDKVKSKKRTERKKPKNRDAQDQKKLQADIEALAMLNSLDDRKDLIGKSTMAQLLEIRRRTVNRHGH